MIRLVLGFSTLLASTIAHAVVNPVPEPGTFELLALGGVAAAIIALRKRRK